MLCCLCVEFFRKYLHFIRIVENFSCKDFCFAAKWFRLNSQGQLKAKRRTVNFSTEARMMAKVKSRKFGRESFAFGFDLLSIFTFSMLSFFMVTLLGCNEEQNKAVVDRDIPAAAKKAELQDTLNRKFENPDAHFQLGQLYQAEGQWQKAEYHYNIALSFDPSYVQAQASMVKLFLDSGDTAKSRTYAETHINDVSRSAIQSSRLGAAFQKQGLDEYALTCYQRALELEPSSAGINKQVGFYYLGKGDKVRAKEYLVRSFQLDPTQSDVSGQLGRLGVEVKIPEQPGTSNQAQKPAEEKEKEYKILAKHGMMQVESSEKKKSKE